MSYLTKHLWLLIALLVVALLLFNMASAVIIMRIPNLLFQNLLWIVVGILIGYYLFGRHSPKNRF